MRLIMVRHGQTDWNLNHRLQGQTDILLNDTGRQQARALSKRLALMPIDRVYVSPLRRTQETADIALKGRNIPMFFDARLAEIQLGALQGLTAREANALFPDGIWRYAQYGGESLDVLFARLAAFVKQHLPQHGCTLLVMHGMSLRILRTVLEGLSPEVARTNFDTPSCCYCQADYSQGQWQISSFGDTLHSGNGFGTWYGVAETARNALPAGSLVTPFRTLAQALAANPQHIRRNEAGVFSHDGQANGVIHRLEPAFQALPTHMHPELGDGWLWRLPADCPAQTLSGHDAATITEDSTYDPKVI